MKRNPGLSAKRADKAAERVETARVSPCPRCGVTTLHGLVEGVLEARVDLVDLTPDEIKAHTDADRLVAAAWIQRNGDVKLVVPCPGDGRPALPAHQCPKGR